MVIRDPRFLRIDPEVRRRIAIWREAKEAQEKRKRAEGQMNALALIIFLAAITVLGFLGYLR